MCQSAQLLEFQENCILWKEANTFMGTLWELKTLQSLKVRGSRWQEQAPVILRLAPTMLVVSQGLIFFATNRSTPIPLHTPTEPVYRFLCVVRLLGKPPGLAVTEGLVTSPRKG